MSNAAFRWIMFGLLGGAGFFLILICAGTLTAWGTLMMVMACRLFGPKLETGGCP